MSDRIRISVDDLRAQSAELSAIATEFEAQYKLAVNAMKNMKSCMSMAMAVNMIIKMTRLFLFFVSLDSTLQQGVTVANYAADSFENTDSALRKLYGDTFSEEVKKSNPSSQVVKNSTQSVRDRMNALQNDPEYSTPREEQCYGYAQWVFEKIFGIKFGSIDSPKWKLTENGNTITVVSCAGPEIGSVQNFSQMISKATCGDVIQMHWSYTDNGIPKSNEHTAIIKDIIYDSNHNVTNIVVLQGNVPEYGKTSTYSVNDFYSRISGEGNGFSVYHAINYDTVV